jgi:hypothetical protein
VVSPKGRTAREAALEQVTSLALSDAKLGGPAMASPSATVSGPSELGVVVGSSIAMSAI